MHDLVLQNHQAVHAGLEILRKSLKSASFGEGLPSLYFLLIGDRYGLTFDIISHNFEDSFDVFDVEVVDIEFAFQFIDFLMDVELFLFGLVIDGSFNYALLFVLIGFICPR